MGWKAKVETDFCSEAAQRELAALAGDPVYAQFGLATDGYVLVRVMGRLSISIGRRLGELYDNLPKFVAAAHFGLPVSDVVCKIGSLNLDVRIPFSKMRPEDVAASRELVAKTFNEVYDGDGGLGIEVRYNFNPNDSARLRKDVAMAEGLLEEGILPIYVVFSGISPRAEAIERLQRAGWRFVIGADASTFVESLLGLDLSSLLSSAEVQSEIADAMAEVMSSMVKSHAFQRAVATHG